MGVIDITIIEEDRVNGVLIQPLETPGILRTNLYNGKKKYRNMKTDRYKEIKRSCRYLINKNRVIKPPSLPPSGYGDMKNV